MKPRSRWTRAIRRSSCGWPKPRAPINLAAIAGEGQALVEKGALEKAKGSLAKLESLCGASCPETQTLSATIAAGPPARVQTAEAVLPDANSPQAN